MDQVLGVGTTLDEGAVFENIRAVAEAVVDVEGGLVLGESTGGGIPSPCCRARCWSFADGVDDRISWFESCGPRSDS